jgi:hypothetical protein
MSDTEILRQLFKPRAQVEAITNSYGKQEVTLTEALQPDSSVKICHIPNDAVIINVDKFEGPHHVFNCDTGVCKRADYVIISESFRAILYVELKSASHRSSDIVKQLIGAKCFIAYCKEVVRLFWGESDFMAGYRERYISFVEISASQRPAFEQSSHVHDTPSGFLKIKRPNRAFQHFNRLLGEAA